MLHVAWREIPPYKILLTYYVWRLFEWHIPSCVEGHFSSIGSWTTLRRSNVFYYVYRRFFYFCHVFTFFNLFIFIWTFFTTMVPDRLTQFFILLTFTLVKGIPFPLLSPYLPSLIGARRHTWVNWFVSPICLADVPSALLGPIVCWYRP